MPKSKSQYEEFWGIFNVALLRLKISILFTFNETFLVNFKHCVYISEAREWVLGPFFVHFRWRLLDLSVDIFKWLQFSLQILKVTQLLFASIIAQHGSINHFQCHLYVDQPFASSKNRIWRSYGPRRAFNWCLIRFWCPQIAHRHNFQRKNVEKQGRPEYISTLGTLCSNIKRYLL